MAAIRLANYRQMYEGTGEAAALRHVAEQAFTGPQTAAVEQLLKDDEDGGCSGIALAGQVGEPALLRNRQPDLGQPLGQALAKELGGVVRQEVFDLLHPQVALLQDAPERLNHGKA